STVSASTRPPTETTTRPAVGVIVIGCSGPGTLICRSLMAVSRWPQDMGPRKTNASGGVSGLLERPLDLRRGRLAVVDELRRVEVDLGQDVLLHPVVLAVLPLRLVAATGQEVH